MGIETAILGTAALGAAGSFFGAREQADASSDAARAQADAANRQIDLQSDIYSDQRQLFAPFYSAGLQGLYGSGGVLDLLGHSQPSGQLPNAFAAVGESYGLPPTPQQQREAAAQAQTNQWSNYLTANPDVMRHYTTENVAVSPHLLRGGGRGSDTDGDGRISPEEWAAYHYNTVGRGEGRSFGEPAPAPTPQPVNAFDVVDTGGGRLQPGTGPQTALPSDGTPTEGSMTATLRQTPGYEWLVDESRRAIENSAAARGELLSGAAVNAVNERTLGLADQTYQRSLDNAFRLSGIGTNGVAGIQNAGTNYGIGAGNAFGQIGQAQANGAIGGANAFNSGLAGVTGSIAGGLGTWAGMQGGGTQQNTLSPAQRAQRDSWGSNWS